MMETVEFKMMLTASAWATECWLSVGYKCNIVISMSKSPQDNHTFCWALNKSRNFTRLSNYLFLHLTSITSLQRESHTVKVTLSFSRGLLSLLHTLGTGSGRLSFGLLCHWGWNKSTHVMTKVIQIHRSSNSRSESLKL